MKKIVLIDLYPGYIPYTILKALLVKQYASAPYLPGIYQIIQVRMQRKIPVN